MALMIFLPQIIWEEEDHYRSMRREKMTIISKAEDFYYQLMGEYTLDTEEGEKYIRFCFAKNDQTLTKAISSLQ